MSHDVRDAECRTSGDAGEAVDQTLLALLAASFQELEGHWEVWRKLLLVGIVDWDPHEVLVFFDAHGFGACHRKVDDGADVKGLEEFEMNFRVLQIFSEFVTN